LTQVGGVYTLKLSDDGKTVAFTHQVGINRLEIWGINLDGTDQRRLVSLEALDAIAEGVRDPSAIAILPSQVEWVPGTHLLAFNTYQVYEGPGMKMLDDLQLVNADSSERWTLLQPGHGGNFYYSPDGGNIAIVTPTDIRLIDANAGNNRQVLNYNQVITYSEYRFYAHPVWSPDGMYLMLAVPPVDPLANPPEATGIWRIPGYGATAQQVSSVWSVPFIDTPVEFSPDLKHLTYLKETGQPPENRRDLRVALTDGSSDLVVQNAPQLRFQGWGKDSFHFSYFTGEDPSLVIANLEGPIQQFIPEPDRVYNLSWIDARNFLYLNEVDGGFELYLGSLDGENTLIDFISGSPPEYSFINP